MSGIPDGGVDINDLLYFPAYYEGGCQARAILVVLCLALAAGRRGPPEHSMARRTLVALLGLSCALLAGGCNIMGIGGVIAENYKRTSTHSIDPKCDQLKGKAFAVVISAGRAIDGEHPGVTDELLARITERLAAHAGASGVVPAADVQRYTYNHPGWQGMAFTELGKELGGVERLVFVELQEFRLIDPGNKYEWNGVATGIVGVAELDSITPDALSYEQIVSVKFPDKQGSSAEDMVANIVASTLIARFTDRASWLFYKHEEPYYPEY